MLSDGRDRTYLVAVPAKLDRSKLAPLVIWLHASGGTIAEELGRSGIGLHAEQRGFVAVLPQAYGSTYQWNAGLCCGAASKEGVDDVAFIARVIDAMTKEYPIDADRVYAGGLSMGGTMANRLACELADRIAAIAAVPGTFYATACRPSRPVSVIAVHGTADTNMPYEGGKGPTSPDREMVQPSVESVNVRWRELFGCAAPTVERTPPVTKTSAGCRGATDVVLYQVEGGRHVPPLGSATGETMATKDLPLVLDFFFAHRRSAAP